MPDERQLIDLTLARSRSLGERLQDAAAATDAPVGNPAVDVLAPWIKVFSPGNPDALARRLSWDSITLETAARALGTSNDVPGAETDPALRQELEALVRSSRSGTVLPVSAPDIPFFPALRPFLRLAHDSVAGAIEESRVFSANAVADLLRELALQLSWWASPTLFQRLEATRARGDASFERFCSSVADHPLEVWSDHAALLRRLLRLTTQWISSTIELARRLSEDRELVASTLGVTVDHVEQIRTGLSDRHHGGRQVAILRLSGGHGLVYKPRESRSLLRFNELLDWYSRHGGDESPRAIRVVDCGDHAWIEFAPHEELASRDEVALYFRRAGALLFFAWILGGRDLHMDNLICTAAGPVIIDTEVFVQPGWTEDSEHHPGAIQLARRKVSGSVIGTGMLSFPQEDASGRVYDIGGLCGRGGYVSPAPRRAWRNVNTDNMELVEEEWTVDSMENVVRCEGRIESPEDWIAEIVSGFEAAATKAISLRHELLAPNGPLARFGDASARILFRPSNHYATLLQTMTSVACSRSGLTASLYIESLARVFIGEESVPELWPLVRDERESLERLDIPLFTVSCSSDAIATEDGRLLEGLIAKSGVQALAKRVRNLDPEAVAEQSKLIRATLASSARHSDDEEEESPITTVAPRSSQLFVDEAIRIGETLLSASIRGSDGAVTWVAPEYVKITSIADLGATYYLYSGVTGPSIFLAALGRLTGDDRFAGPARGAWKTLEHLIASGDAKPVRNQLRLGICNGIGSIIYAAIVAGALLDDPSLLELARGFAELIDPERLDTETDFDIEGGLAGAALALVRLNEATGEPRWLELAGRALRRVADLAASDESGAWWPQSDTPPLAGMAHGASGAALALASSSLVTGDPDQAALAREAMRWERTIYDSSMGNWPVRTSDGRRIDMVAWCHGAAGIGLTRVATRSLVGTMFDEDLDLAVRSVLATGLHPVDHLCCGNTGRIELLVDASRALGQPGLLDEARRRALAVIERASTRGSFTLTTDAGEGLVRPGFFRGLSGIGYTLLRTADPAGLPAVSRFELRQEDIG